jgi:hypothetical protein
MTGVLKHPEIPEASEDRAPEGNGKSTLALSSFIHALLLTNKFVNGLIARNACC